MIWYKSIASIYFLVPCFAAPCEQWSRELEKGLETYHPETIPEKYSSARFYEWELQAGVRDGYLSYGEGDTGSAVLNLWRAKKIHLLELLWWKSRQRETRLLIMSLFLGNRLEDISGLPSFDSSRFNEKEAEERRVEEEYVRKHRTAIHEILKKHGLLQGGQSGYGKPESEKRGE